MQGSGQIGDSQQSGREEGGRRPGLLTSRQKVELVFWERNALTSPHLGGPQRQDRALGKQLPACSEEGLFTVSWSRWEGVAGGGDLTRPPPMCVLLWGSPGRSRRTWGSLAPLQLSLPCSSELPWDRLFTSQGSDSSRILLHARVPEGPAHSLEL